MPAALNNDSPDVLPEESARLYGDADEKSGMRATSPSHRRADPRTVRSGRFRSRRTHARYQRAGPQQAQQRGATASALISNEILLHCYELNFTGIVQHLCGVLARLSLLEKVFNVFNLRVSNMKQAEGEHCGPSLR